MKILIVEDDVFTAQRIQADLESAGHVVTGNVRSLTGAIQGIREAPADLVILDISLGEKSNTDGLELAYWLGELNQKPFIFLTGHLEPPPGVENTKSYSYITKPYLKSQLLMQVRLAFDRFTEGSRNAQIEKGTPDRFYLRVNGFHAGIAFDDLLCVRAGNRHVEVHTIDTGRNPYQIGTHLGDVAHFFLHPDLVFIKPSIIVNRKHIRGIREQGIELGPHSQLVELSSNARKKLMNELCIVKTRSKQRASSE